MIRDATMKSFLSFILALVILRRHVASFKPTRMKHRRNQLCATSNNKLTSLPQGISPFQKSISKSLDVQGELRKLAKGAVDKVIQDSQHKFVEIEFPPLLGGRKSKSQFDDFDNIQELDANRDWAIEFACSFVNNNKSLKTWLIFPDTKECEIAKREWPGQRYRQSTFTTIEAVTEYSSANTYDSPWGAAMSKMVSKIMQQSSKDSNSNRSDMLGDVSSLDPLNGSPTISIVVQPGNGGPVEDWINCEKIAQSNTFQASGGIMVIINGALDKVRDGFYPALFFPKLATTVDRFYKKFESALYLRPVSDKGVYGWIFRVYPEQWQVVLQSKKYRSDGEIIIVDQVVYASEKRPSYSEAVSYLLAASKTVN